MKINVWVLVVAGWVILISGIWAGIDISKKSKEVSEWKEKFFRCQSLLLSSDEKIKEKDALILKSASGNKDLVASTKLYVGAMEEEKAQIEKKYGDLLKENTDLKFQVENLVLGIKEERKTKEESVEAYIKLVEYTKKVIKNRDEWKASADDYYQAAIENATAANQARMAQYYQQIEQPKTQTIQLPRMITDDKGNQYRTVNMGGGTIMIQGN